VNHFQDATILRPGESKCFISYEEALYFQSYITSRTTNDFTKRPFVVTPNYHLGLGHHFELGAQVLPFTVFSDGGNFYFKYSDSLSSFSSLGVVALGGVSEATGNDDQAFVLFGQHRMRYSKASNFGLMVPFTITMKRFAFTISPGMGSYHAYLHDIYTSDNHIVSNYLLPSVSTDASFNLPLNSFVSFEFCAIQIENAILGFYGLGFGMKGNPF